jgi:hypothetical protein
VHSGTEECGYRKIADQVFLICLPIMQHRSATFYADRGMMVHASGLKACLSVLLLALGARFELIFRFDHLTI